MRRGKTRTLERSAMAEPKLVTCTTHGVQPRALVCQHIVQGLRDRARVGFYWAAEDPADPRPDAWCRECEQRVRLTNGEWVGQALEQLQPKVLCGVCYDAARTFNLGGNPWS